MRWVIWIVGALVVLGIVITAVGYMLPKAHSVTRSTRVAAPPEAVYALLIDVDKYPEWRHGDPVPFRFERMERPSLLVSRISDPSLPFGGAWTYRIAPDGTGSMVTVTEDGEVYHPIFRFMSRFVFGHTATIEQFFRDLEARAR